MRISLSDTLRGDGKRDDLGDVVGGDRHGRVELLDPLLGLTVRRASSAVPIPAARWRARSCPTARWRNSYECNTTPASAGRRLLSSLRERELAGVGGHFGGCSAGRLRPMRLHRRRRPRGLRHLTDCLIDGTISRSPRLPLIVLSRNHSVADGRRHRSAGCVALLVDYGPLPGGSPRKHASSFPAWSRPPLGSFAHAFA
jgi:hypothetical protein